MTYVRLILVVFVVDGCTDKVLSFDIEGSKFVVDHFLGRALEDIRLTGLPMNDFLILSAQSSDYLRG